MQPGYLLDRYDNNRRRPAEWVEGAPEPGFWMGLKLGDRLALEVQSWRCPDLRLAGQLRTAARPLIHP